ncbi:MAG TPA: hypothetical protein VE907_13850 [Gammaproteobacteria bacterium]|nr:hypothetical protein [Gammaproteobacteria bacterium]
MESDFVPVSLMVFWFVALLTIGGAVKAVIDARVRTKLITSNPSDALVKALLVDQRMERRHSSLRWGLVLSFIAGGFVLVELLGWKDLRPGTIGILFGATGLGNLAFYVIERLLQRDGSGQ